MIRELERKYYKLNAPNKYHIDCDFYSKNTDKIHITNLVRHNNDISILEAVIEKHQQKQRHIVVKIGKENRTIEKEFLFGKILETEKIPGFISYICIFECLDDTHKQKKIPNSICTTNEDNSDNRKKVLIMPYIESGSILKFEWKVEMFPTLISTIQQVLMSSFVAFYICGFIHGDFHLDNIMMKKTKKKDIKYNWGNVSKSIPTNGYKIVILDFDSSWIGAEIKDKIETYWLNIYNMFSRIQTDLRTKNKEVIRMKNHNKMMMYIDTQIQKKGKIENTLKLIDMISNSDFVISENPMINLKYDPNIFGG